MLQHHSEMEADVRSNANALSSKRPCIVTRPDVDCASGRHDFEEWLDVIKNVPGTSKILGFTNSGAPEPLEHQEHQSLCHTFWELLSRGLSSNLLETCEWRTVDWISFLSRFRRIPVLRSPPEQLGRNVCAPELPKRQPCSSASPSQPCLPDVGCGSGFSTWSRREVINSVMLVAKWAVFEEAFGCPRRWKAHWTRVGSIILLGMSAL